MKTSSPLIGSAFTALFLCLSLSAMAQTASRVLVTAGATLGASPLIVSNSKNRTHLELLNQSPSATVFCTIDGSTPTATPTANQISIPPLGGFVWTSGVIPTNTVICLASGTGTPFTTIE